MFKISAVVVDSYFAPDREEALARMCADARCVARSGCSMSGEMASLDDGQRTLVIN